MHRSSRSLFTIAFTTLAAAACTERQPQPLEPSQQIDATQTAVQASPIALAISTHLSYCSLQSC